MLPPKNRLKSQIDFQHILQSGSSFFSPCVRVRWIKNAKTASRLGIIVSKKEFPTAVARNNAKRRMRSIFLECINEIYDGRDILVTLGKRFVEISYTEAKNEARTVFEKSNLLRK